MKNNYLLIIFLLFLRISDSQAQTSLKFIEVHKQGINNVNGLSNVNDVTVSADGKFVYASSYVNSSVVCFARDTFTGKLTYSSIVSNIPGLAAAFSVSASSDNKNIYVASPSGYVTAFSKNSNTGALTVVNSIHAGTGNTISVSGFVTVYASPNGKWVYAIGASGTKGLVVFTRDNVTGAITYLEEHLNDFEGNLLNQDFSPNNSPINNIAISNDSKFLYVTATLSNAVSIYSINQETGNLTLIKTYVDNVNGVDGIEGASSLLLSSDGNHLYVSGQKENSIATFSVNKTNGILTYLNKITQNVNEITSLNGVRSLAINPDGKYLYASAVESNSVTSFRRNSTTGQLTLNTAIKSNVDGVTGLAGASGMIMDPLGRNLYVAGAYESSLTVLLGNTPAIIFTKLEVTTDNNSQITLDNSLSITDLDSENLKSASVQIIDGTINDNLIVDTQNDITVVFDKTTQTLNLTGIASITKYQELLRSLKYTPSLNSNIPEGTISYRKINIRITDDEDNISADTEILVKINPEKFSQTITFTKIEKKFTGDPIFALTGTASSGLPITYTSSDETVARILGNKVQIIKPGTVIISAIQNGNEFFKAANVVTQSFTIIDNSPPTLTISSDRGLEVSKGTILNLSANGANTYEWENTEGILSSINASSISIRPRQTTTYTVTGFNKYNTASTKSITISVIEDYKLLNIINTLTPNGDGINDIWLVENIDLYPNNTVKVFDKTGKLVFDMVSYNNSWGGTYKGQYLPEGTYYYFIDFGSGIGVRNGSISIVGQ